MLLSVCRPTAATYNFSPAQLFQVYAIRFQQQQAVVCVISTSAAAWH